MTKLSKVVIGLGAFVAVIAIVVCVVPLETVAYTVDVPYEEVETYYVQELMRS